MSCILLRYVSRLGICRNVKPSTVLKYGEPRISRQNIVPQRHTQMTKKNPFSRMKLTRQEKDKVPKDYVLIFTNYNGNSNRIAVVIIQCTFVLFGYSLPFYFPEGFKFLEDIGSIFLKINMILIIMAVTSFAALVYRRAMLRIYKDINTNKYVGIVPRWILSLKKIDFTVENITKNTSKSSLSRLFRGDVQIKGRPFIFSSNHFAQPKFYNEILKYDIENEKKK